MSTRPTEVAEAPKTDSYFCEIPNDPCAIVMFGASGDLARRKLLPALYDLALHSCLAPRFRLLGFARSEMNDDAFRKTAGEFLSKVDKDGANGDRTARNSWSTCIISTEITTIPSRTRDWRSAWKRSMARASSEGIGCSIWRRRRRFTSTSSNSWDERDSRNRRTGIPGRG